MDKPLIDVILDGARRHDNLTMIAIAAAICGWLCGIVAVTGSEKKHK